MITQLRSSRTAAGGHLAEVLGRGAPKADEVMARGGAAAVVGEPASHAEHLKRVIVARPTDHDPAGLARVRFPAVIGAVRIGPEHGRRPFPEISENVVDAVRAGPGRSARCFGGVVRASEDRAPRRRRREAPWIRPPVVVAGCLLPLGFGRQAPALPRAVVAGAEPRDFYCRMSLEAGVGVPASVGSMDPRVGVVL